MTDNDSRLTPNRGGPDPLSRALAALHEQRDSTALRRFAAAASRTVLGDAPPTAHHLVDAADHAAAGDDAQRARVRYEFSGAASAAGTIGLRIGAVNAPALLAAFAACAPNPFDAAKGAAHYVGRHVRLAGLDAAVVDRSLLNLPPQ